MVVNSLAMRALRPVPTVLLLVSAACNSRQEADLSRVKSEVRSFAQTVAENVTRRGPSAWQDFFEDGQSFYMAVDGHVEFVDGAAVRAAMPELTRTIRKLDLQWGGAMRIDALTADLASIGTPWHEIIDLADGTRLDNSGYFTALVERRGGSWQFRNAHWSTLPAGK
jgi:hypothetical protein